MTPAMSMCAQLRTSTNSCMGGEEIERREGREGDGVEEKRGSGNPAQNQSNCFKNGSDSNIVQPIKNHLGFDS